MLKIGTFDVVLEVYQLSFLAGLVDSLRMFLADSPTF